MIFSMLRKKVTADKKQNFAQEDAHFNLRVRREPIVVHLLVHHACINIIYHT